MVLPRREVSMRSKTTKQTVPHYAFTVSEVVQPFLEDTVAEQLAKLIRKQSRQIAREILQDFEVAITERVMEDSRKREFATTLRKKESWEK